MHDNDGDDNNGYDDDGGNGDDDEARYKRGFAWFVNWPVNIEWIGETQETQSWSVNYTLTVIDSWSSNIVVRESRFITIEQM